ncbi:hypothetical protein NB705_003362 [Xanthomonas sacchari]|nr:hypothetical protein [Xanthomonas sacchari]
MHERGDAPLAFVRIGTARSGPHPQSRLPNPDSPIPAFQGLPDEAGGVAAGAGGRADSRSITSTLGSFHGPVTR